MDETNETTTTTRKRKVIKGRGTMPAIALSKLKPRTISQAEIAYTQRIDEARALVATLQRKIDAHAERIATRRRQTGRETDWADVGDMAEMASKLNDAAAFFGGV